MFPIGIRMYHLSSNSNPKYFTVGNEYFKTINTTIPMLNRKYSFSYMLKRHACDLFYANDVCDNLNLNPSK